VLAVLALAGCGGAVPEPPPHATATKHNVVLLTLDTTRADHLGIYGRKEAATPHLDRLGRDGVVFDMALTAAPLTLPAHSSIMTGLFPPRHGVRDNGTFYLDDRFTTLAEVLHDAGYATGAFLGAAVLEKKYGLGQGFDVYDDDFPRRSVRPEFLFVERPANEVVASALAWLGSAARPFFVWLHFYDAHAEYEPPPPYDQQFHETPYDGEIAFVDHAVEALFDWLAGEGLADDTIVVAVGDHGESLGEHGEPTHGVFVYDATIRVPLLVRGPGVPTGRRIDGVVRTVDLMPTVLALVGLATPNDVDGRSLVGVMSGGHESPRVAYAEAELPHYHYGWAPLVSLQTATWKLIEAPKPELYRLASDPRELINVYDREPATVRELTHDLDTLRTAADSESRRTLDAATEQKLRSLGYVTDAAPPPSDGPGPDPKDMIATHVRMQRGRNLLTHGQLDAAIAEFRQIVDENPRSFATWLDLAQAYDRKREFDAARASLDRARALAPDSAPVYVQLGMLESERGRHDEARALFETAIGKDPRSATALTALAATLTEEGQLDRARETVERALAIDPRSPDALVALGRIALRRDDASGAEDAFTKALHVDPYHANALMSLGTIKERAGDYTAALGYYEEAIKSVGGRADLHQAIGSVLSQLGRADEAEAHLLEAIRLEPDLADAHATLAVVADQKGQPERAIAENREAIRLAPRAHRPHGNLAVIFIRRGDFRAARDELERALALEPTYPEAYNNLAVVALSEGDLDQARVAVERALALRPAYPEALTNRGIVAERQGDRRAAADYHRRALAVNPGYVEARNNLANTLVGLGEYADAARELETVLHDRPSLASAHKDLADLYAQHLGNEAAARVHYEAYLRLAPKGPDRDDAARAIAALAGARHP